MIDHAITIKSLAKRIGASLAGDGDAVASDVTHDSRQVRQGTVFAAIKGETVDGHRFIDDVVRRGAAAIISENGPPPEFPIPWLTVQNARVALAQAAAAINGDPSQKLDLIGITGTNGKTTTTYLCFALAAAAGKKAAMLTTVEYRIGDRSEPAVRTTPEASDTNRFLREAVDEGCTVGVMEASSQAIDLHRCDGLKFRVAIFTNLTRDHLDYHGTMENYFDAKKRLFDGRLGEPPNCCVVNVDDSWGRKLSDELTGHGQRVVTFSLTGEADLFASKIEVSLTKGTTFLLNTGQGTVEIASPLVGAPHVYNMLAATAASLELGIGLSDVKRGLAACIGAPGRFERVPDDGDFAVFVDYAHTDDALLNTLQTARDLVQGKIITVFGCGGDRDRTKRGPMGEIASRLSDQVIITSDNPRNEDPLQIIAAIEAGVKEHDTPYEIIPDRRQAIGRAISLAGSGDVVMIAGKGHEHFQMIGSEKYHFDDREVALESLAAKRAES